MVLLFSCLRGIYEATAWCSLIKKNNYTLVPHCRISAKATVNHIISAAFIAYVCDRIGVYNWCRAHRIQAVNIPIPCGWESGDPYTSNVTLLLVGFLAIGDKGQILSRRFRKHDCIEKQMGTSIGRFGRCTGSHCVRAFVYFLRVVVVANWDDRIKAFFFITARD